MKLNFNRQHTTIAVYAFLVLAAAILFNSLLDNFPSVRGLVSTVAGLLMPFVYAFGIAYILNPVLKVVERVFLRRLFGTRIGDKPMRALAILLTYLFSAGMIAIFAKIVLPQLVLSISGLIARMTAYLNSTETWLPGLLALLGDFDISATIETALRQYADTIMSSAMTMLKQLFPWMLSVSTGIASGLLTIVVGIIISIYMLMDKERFCAGIKKIWYAVLPKKNADWILDLAAEANHVFGGFIGGKILDSLIIGILCFIGMSLLGMPSAMLVSVIVGVTNVIPYFGPFIGAIPSFFIILIDAPIKALWFLVFVLILQQFDGNILGPKILGDSTGLSAFWVIFAIMLFGGLYGFIGMFLGVPVFSVIYMLIQRFIDSRLSAREMPVDIESYCAPDAPLLRTSAQKQDTQDKPRRRGAHVPYIGRKKTDSDTHKDHNQDQS